jgi:hypothetical protein
MRFECMLIPQRLPRLQRVLNPLLSFLLTAKRLKTFALQIQNVLLADRSAPSDVAAAENFRDFRGQLYFVFGDVVALAHQVNPHFEGSENVFSGGGNVGAWLRRLVA